MKKAALAEVIYVSASLSVDVLSMDKVALSVHVVFMQKYARLVQADLNWPLS